MARVTMGVLLITTLGCGTGATEAARAPATQLARAPEGEARHKAKATKAKAGAEPQYDDTKPSLCDSLEGDLQVTCAYGESTGILRCSDYPSHVVADCEAGKFNPDNGRWYAAPKAP